MTEREVIAELATEMWKLQRALERVSRDLSPERQGKTSAQLRYSDRQLGNLLEQAGLQLVTFENEEFSAELPVTPVNAEDVDGQQTCFIDTMLEPAIVANGATVRAGKVILRGA